MTVADPSPGGTADLPERRVSLSRLVAYNMGAFRKAAQLSQQEFGEKVGGWSAASVSAAERSWDGNRVKKFDADEIVSIAAFLGLPLAALFLPPEDDGTTFRYVLENDPGDPFPLRDLLPLLYGAPEADSPAAEAYRRRLIALGWSGAARHAAYEAFDRARRQAEQITGDAAARAAALERDAQERHRQAMGDLVIQREELERRVDELRSFEREYRARLQAYVEGHLLELYGPDNRQLGELRIKEVLEMAATEEAFRATAVMLRGDGTFGILQYPASDTADARDEEEDQAHEG